MNRYCVLAGLVEAPNVDELSVTTSNLFLLMIAVLLERGEPMRTEDIGLRLIEAGVESKTGDIVMSLQKAWHGNAPVYKDPEGQLCLDCSSFELRYALFRLGLGKAKDIRKESRPQPNHRAVLRFVSIKGVVQAVSVLDMEAHSIQTFFGGQLDQLPEALARFDLLAGMHIRDDLYALGLNLDHLQLVDLKPPQKSRRLNQRGSTLKITPELLITSTTGISRPLGDSRKMLQYLKNGEMTKLARRLESDVKALYAFYQYGALHGCVRLRWGFLNETIGCDWALPDEQGLYQQLKWAAANQATIDLVTGSSPGWGDPWARAMTGVISKFEVWNLSIQTQYGGTMYIDRYDIQAIRIHSQHDLKSGDGAYLSGSND